MPAETTRILITGANGFVGRHLIAHLLDVYQNVWIAAAVHPEHVAQVWNETEIPADRAGWNGSAAGGRVEVVGLDITDAGATTEALERARPHHIYHLAARASGADTERDAVFAVNVEGTRHLLEAAAGLRPTARVLLVSTGYVYGNTDPDRPVQESDAIGPEGKFGPYTDSKIAMERLAKDYHAVALIARAFSHTGPGQMPTFALPAFALQIARIERGLEAPIIRVGNLEARRDLLDVRDVVRAYSALMHQGSVGEVYNVATGQPNIMRDLLDMLRALCSTQTEVERDPARLRPADIICSTGDANKIWKVTRWQPRMMLETTLGDTLDYWRQQIEANSGA